MTTAATRVGLCVSVAILCGFSGTAAPGQVGTVTVTGTAAVVGARGVVADSRDVVVWLKPLPAAASGQAPRNAPVPRAPTRMIQRNKRFEPGLLVVPAGATIEFPNMDPFFHNVFSMFDGKRFDLGLYEAGSSRSVTFGTTGTSYVFCNIHPEMSAVIVVVDTPYYAVTNRAGEFTLPRVPEGRYALSIWHQRHKAERPADFPREVSITQAASSLGTLRLLESREVIAPHLNKYGRDYVAPPTASPLYKK